MARDVVRAASSSRAFTLDLGHALFEVAQLSCERAQLLGDYLVVIHSGNDPAAVKRASTRRVRF